MNRGSRVRIDHVRLDGDAECEGCEVHPDCTRERSAGISPIAANGRTTMADEIPTEALEAALAMIRNDPAVLRQIAELSALTAMAMEDVARACALLMIGLATSSKTGERGKSDSVVGG